jgi:hypothetical protein
MNLVMMPRMIITANYRTEQGVKYSSIKSHCHLKYRNNGKLRNKVFAQWKI